MSISGHVSPGFDRVREAFAANFSSSGEFNDLGAGLAVYLRGQRVVQLHGGFRDPERLFPWDESTLVNVWSASKAILAVAIARLVDDGLVRYDRPVADYWPEFAAEGKAAVTVADVLSHRAGMNGFAEPTTPSDLFDWGLITARLARQRPLWPPGSTTSYHGMTFGWLGGEIVRRVAGMEPRDFIRAFVAAPLGADLGLGCPADRRRDVAVIVPPEPDRSPVALSAVASWPTRNPAPDAAAANTDAWRDAQIPAVNVHCTADGLARVYAALANRGTLDAVRLLSAAGVDELRRMRSAGPDEMLGPRRWAAGVALNRDGMFGQDPEAFGHAGWGGSLGCASVADNVAIAYVVNRMGSRLNGDPRARSICDAVYDCL